MNAPLNITTPDRAPQTVDDALSDLRGYSETWQRIETCALDLAGPDVDGRRPTADDWRRAAERMLGDDVSAWSDVDADDIRRVLRERFWVSL